VVHLAVLLLVVKQVRRALRSGDARDRHKINGRFIVISHRHAPTILRDLAVVAAVRLAVDGFVQGIESGFRRCVRWNVEFDHHVHVVLILGDARRDSRAGGEAATRVAFNHLAVERASISVGLLTKRIEVLDCLLVHVSPAKRSSDRFDHRIVDATGDGQRRDIPAIGRQNKFAPPRCVSKSAPAP
jgi:hypothetical protein